MTTHEFVKMQLAKPFKERHIPDSLYIRIRTFRSTLHYLGEGRQPENAGLCFQNDFMYEHFTRFLDSFCMLYPNVVITKEECHEYL